MNYPDWAPTSLISLHKKRLELDSADRKVDISDPDEYIKKLREQDEYKAMPAEAFENLREQMWRTTFGLPNYEADILLEKLITDQRMKEVWASLARRKVEDRDEFFLWIRCQKAITGWRGEPKVTHKEKLNVLKEIQSSAAKLRSNMHKLREFEFYSITKLIEDESIKWLLEVLDSDWIIGMSQKN